MGNTMQSPDTERPGTRGVQAVDRAITCLEILAQGGEAGVSEVAAQVGVHKSTVFRLLGALEARGLVEQTEQRGKYRLGFGIIRLAGAVSARMDVVSQGRPVCERLAGELGETVNLAVAQEHYVVNLEQVHGTSNVSTHNWVGQLTPLHATSSGKVLLAYLDGGLVDHVLDAGFERFTDRTIASAQELERDLAQIRAQGYGVAAQEYEVGLNAMAAPIRSSYGRVIAAVSVSGPVFRFTEEHMHEVAPVLVEGADEISRRLGYVGRPATG
jgi:DNA-binding IclR family transcriptional regulator